jgi:hypothetical protein
MKWGRVRHFLIPHVAPHDDCVTVENIDYGKQKGRW